VADELDGPDAHDVVGEEEDGQDECSQGSAERLLSVSTAVEG
jgi:hypothetical protein